MRIGVIIPDRGDRPGFLNNCLRLVKKQTLAPTVICVVDRPALSEQCDITARYREGYDVMRGRKLDLVAFMENDDWYSLDYLEYMAKSWHNAGRPEIFGTNEHACYHLMLNRYYYVTHRSRSMAMNTVLKADMDFKWCVDHEPYTDAWLWRTLKGKLIKPEKNICLSIKHGIGKCGSNAHKKRLNFFQLEDPDRVFLRNFVDAESFKFYSTICGQ